ncbi:MAG TPA: hypothetical protein VF532_16860 [Candidatus Angelobacter sp.]
MALVAREGLGQSFSIAFVVEDGSLCFLLTCALGDAWQSAPRVDEGLFSKVLFCLEEFNIDSINQQSVAHPIFHIATTLSEDMIFGAGTEWSKKILLCPFGNRRALFSDGTPQKEIDWLVMRSMCAKCA